MAAVGFSYGILFPKLEEQAKRQGFLLKNAETMEKIRESITCLAFNDILPDSQIRKAYEKLQKKVVRNLKPLEQGGESQ